MRQRTFCLVVLYRLHAIHMFTAAASSLRRRIFIFGSNLIGCAGQSSQRDSRCNKLSRDANTHDPLIFDAPCTVQNCTYTQTQAHTHHIYFFSHVFYAALRPRMSINVTCHLGIHYYLYVPMYMYIYSKYADSL